MEPVAARLAAERRDEGVLGEVAEAVSRMKAETLATPEGPAPDRRFHAAVLKAAGNEVLMSMASGIAAAVNWTTAFKFRMKRLRRDPIPDHERVLDAIAAADPPRAEAAMTRLVMEALNDTRLTMRRL